MMSSNILYWKKTSETTWHKLTSSSPITYTRENTKPDFEGGQCPTFYRAICWGIYFGQWRQLDTFLTGPIPGSYRTVPTGGTANGEPAYGRQILDATGWKVIGFSNMIYQDAITWRVTQLIRLDNQPDNCGNPKGECKTSFYTNGALITSVTDETCVDVSEEKPECECCSELLPKANAILARLSQ